VLRGRDSNKNKGISRGGGGSIHNARAEIPVKALVKKELQVRGRGELESEKGGYGKKNGQ